MLKLLPFPVNNLRSGWKLPQGSFLTRCCLHGPGTGAQAGLAPAAGRAPHSLQHPRPRLEGQPVPPGGLLQREGHGRSQNCWPEDERPTSTHPWGPHRAARAPFALVESVESPEKKDNTSGCTHPPRRQVPATLLISLCLSLLTISSSTSPSPLMSLEDKCKVTSREGYWQVPAATQGDNPHPRAAPVPQLCFVATSPLSGKCPGPTSL